MPELAINPWLSLWRYPRRTFRHLLDEAPGYNVLTLASLTGIAAALGQASGHGLGSQVALWPLLAICLLLGPLMGLAELWIGSWLLSRIGRWLGGEADSAEMRTVMAWSGLPNVLGLVTWGGMIAELGILVFAPRSPELMQSLAQHKGFVIAAAMQLLLGIWSLWLLCIGVSEAQRLPMLKALLNLLLTAMAALVLLSPIKLLLDQLLA